VTYQLPIVLIGPMATGKTTVGTELARLTGVPRVPMDRVRWYYYFKEGFSLEKESDHGTFAEKERYWKPFEVTAIRCILADFPQSIIDFGAGHSYFPDSDQFAVVEKLLAPLANIFLLLPTMDKQDSLRICNERLRARVGRELEPTEIESNRNFIEQPSNYRLCKQVVYTHGHAPDQVAREIVGRLSGDGLATY
jgi:shikimate kinase